MNLPWNEYEVQHKDYQDVFRFGAGEPLLSTKAYAYPVIRGDTNVCSWLRLALVENTKADGDLSEQMLPRPMVWPPEWRRASP